MKPRVKRLASAVLFFLCAATAVSHAAEDLQQKIKHAVDTSIRPVMAKYGIPGMAVGLTVAGKPYVFTYGVASTATRQPVTRDTLFEIGSISKTFTATLASYAQVMGDLSLSDKTSKYLPALQGRPFGTVSLLNLGTHTPGGLPLQVPENIKNNDELLQYFKHWQATYPPGTRRTYSNIGIGTLGWITARSMRQDFASLMEQRLFPGLGMKSSYIHVPKSDMENYAQGYTRQDKPIRMDSGVLSSEAYGVKTTAPDMIHFVEENINPAGLNKPLQHAITETHTGYFQAGPMTQDLIWEQYPYPVTLNALLEGNSAAMAFDATPVTEIKPPEKPREDVWINKTGSTNGFGAYVAFVPEKRFGIVILANKNYPNDARVTAAFEILTAIADGTEGDSR
ncbi:MAG TPA: class C beta-lactamase [Acidobacteriaceae bacterium]|nr:class C beta-lactamase [Acidobacteriaceae bacterium]